MDKWGSNDKVCNLRNYPQMTRHDIMTEKVFPLIYSDPVPWPELSFHWSSCLSELTVSTLSTSSYCFWYLMMEMGRKGFSLGPSIKVQLSKTRICRVNTSFFNLFNLICLFVFTSYYYDDHIRKFESKTFVKFWTYKILPLRNPVFRLNY